MSAGLACCPPGNVSNIFTHRARGDVALSVSMTAVGNVLSIVLLPLNFAFWGHLHPTGREYFTEISVAPWDMLSEVVLVIGLPFALGLTVSHLLPRVAARTHRVVGVLSFVALGGIIVIAVANNWALSRGSGCCSCSASSADWAAWPWSPPGGECGTSSPG